MNTQLPKRFGGFPRATGKIGEMIAEYEAGGLSARQLAKGLLQQVEEYQPPEYSRTKSITFNSGVEVENGDYSQNTNRRSR